MGIHNYEKNYFRELATVKQSNLSERNKKFILDFINDLVIENISIPRQLRYSGCLRIMAQKLGKDFDQATEEDLKRLVASIQQQNYSPWTKQAYKVIIRRFYKWLYKSKTYPEIVSWININIHRSQKKLPSEGDLLTEDDIRKLLDSADHIRDKALISILWESGSRIGEIGDLCLKHVKFDKQGIVLTVKGKTGSRNMRLIFSTPYLSTWISVHPLRHDTNAPLWVNVGTTNKNKQMNYAGIRRLILVLFSKAGIRKRSNPHLFRHSRATFMANHLTEFQMNQYFGWIQGSDMPSTYVHMSGREVDNAILKMNGLSSEIQSSKPKILPKICPRCDTINAEESTYCMKCGGILDLKYALELEEKQKQYNQIREQSDQIMNLLLKDADVQAVLLEKLKNLQGINLSL